MSNRLLLFGFLLFSIAFVIIDAQGCGLEKSEDPCPQTEYVAYINCIQKRSKRSVPNCQQAVLQFSCNECDCNYCAQNDCSEECKACCKPTCDTPYCCHKTCHAQCKHSACRKECKKTCGEQIEKKSEEVVVSELGQAPNITTIINLKNNINNTNIIDVPVYINNTNVNDIVLGDDCAKNCEGLNCCDASKSQSTDRQSVRSGDLKNLQNSQDQLSGEVNNLQNSQGQLPGEVNNLQNSQGQLPSEVKSNQDNQVLPPVLGDNLEQNENVIPKEPGRDQNNIAASNKEFKKGDSCCQLISPRQCVPKDEYPFMQCYHYRKKTCGAICESPIMHAQPHLICDEVPLGPPNCHNQVIYVPQPQPRCTYQEYWPYVTCQLSQSNCDGCYDQFTGQQSNTECPVSCTMGYNVGPYQGNPSYPSPYPSYGGTYGGSYGGSNGGSYGYPYGYNSYPQYPTPNMGGMSPYENFYSIAKDTQALNPEVSDPNVLYTKFMNPNYIGESQKVPSADGPSNILLSMLSNETVAEEVPLDELEHKVVDPPALVKVKVKDPPSLVVQQAKDNEP